MISFMVLSAPRSGSTWASNWLTTEWQLCIHDPVLDTSIEHLDCLPHTRRYGLACTGLPLLVDWVNARECPKVILHRSLKEVNQSLKRIGLTPLPSAWDGVLERLAGWHVHYSDLFKTNHARALWTYLLPDEPFDAERHALLSQMHIDPHFPRVAVDRARTRAVR